MIEKLIGPCMRRVNYKYKWHRAAERTTLSLGKCCEQPELNSQNKLKTLYGATLLRIAVTAFTSNMLLIAICFIPHHTPAYYGKLGWCFEVGQT